MSKADPYNFAPSFEAILVTVVCRKLKMWASIGVHLLPDCLGRRESKLAIEACKSIYKDSAVGSTNLTQVLQRLQRQMGDGKVTHKDIVAVSAMFDEAEEAGEVPDESLIAEVVPLLRRRMEKEALETALAEYQRHGDTSKALMVLEKAQALGLQDAGTGLGLGWDSIEHIQQFRNLSRMSTGIMELDEVLDGGIPNCTGTMYMAGTGGGKSMMLTLQACSALAQGAHVGFATLELPTQTQHARMLACMTGVLVSQIENDPFSCGAIEAYEELSSLPGWGSIKVKEFSPRMTSMVHVESWIKDCEAEWGHEMDALVIDYADKMRAVGRSDKVNDSDYARSGSVYDDIFAWARDNRRRAFTASQVRRLKQGAKPTRFSTDDVADSMGKVRNFDIVIGLNKLEDQMTFGVEKNRLGRSDCSAGPLPCDFFTARIGPFVPEATYRKQLGKRKPGGGRVGLR